MHQVSQSPLTAKTSNFIAQPVGGERGWICETRVCSNCGLLYTNNAAPAEVTRLLKLAAQATVLLVK